MAPTKVFIVVLLVASVFALERGTRVVYNGDTRIDEYQASSSLQGLGDGVVLIAFGGASSLSQNNDGTYTVTSAQSAASAWNLCPEEPFSSQQVITATAYCTGFLLSTNPPWVATSGACASLSTSAVVIFDYNQLDANNSKSTFPANDVYTISRVVATGGNTNTGNDWGVVELDRNVVGRNPYTSINQNPSVGASVTLIGYPLGIPKKYDVQGLITLTPSSGVFNAFVDGFTGNVGSPVFDSNGNILGIYVAGAQDFVTSNGCDISNQCPGGPTCDSTGETITLICQLGRDSRLSSLGLCGSGNTNTTATTTASPSIPKSPKASASQTPQPSSTPSAAPNAPKNSQALVTNAYIQCPSNCTDFTELEGEIAAYLDIDPADVQIVALSRDRSSAYVELTICATNSSTLVEFSNGILSGDLDIGITQNEEIVVRDAQYKKSCPIVFYVEPTSSSASSLGPISLIFAFVVVAVFAIFAH